MTRIAIDPGRAIGRLDRKVFGGFVEYCNSAGRTAWADRRRANGREEPWRVTYWGLGNEMYGDWQVGAFTAEEYVREATRWALDQRAPTPSGRTGDPLHPGPDRAGRLPA